MSGRQPGLAIISGGSSGIGKACARELLDRGHVVALLARDAGRLAQAQAELSTGRQGGAVVVAAVDVGNQQACEAVVRGLIDAHGPPDWVIASAGMARPGLFLEQPVEDHAAHVQVNLLGTVHLLKAATPAMVEARHGRVVLVSSGAAFLGIYGYSAYAPSKFAVRGLAEILRLELAPHGISVTLACPPDTDTPQLAQEELTKPAVTRRVSSGAGVWSAAQVAAAIIEAGLKGRFMVGPGWAIRTLSSFHSVIGPIFRLRQSRLLRHEQARDGASGDV